MSNVELSRYEICVRGHLSEHWSGGFEGLAIKLLDCGNTCLSGFIVDQAALFGVLRKIRDLGLPLLSVNRVMTENIEPKIIH